jgi:phytol kinase
MALASVGVALGILGWTVGWSAQMGLTALAVAIAATALETLSIYGLDNLTVPLGSALLAYVLTR